MSVTSLRYEVKMVFSPYALTEVVSWVRLHTMQWRVAYPPRQINNIYFDSPHYRALNANLSGHARREKLRLRWYGPDVGTFPHSVLELKCKQGMVGWKETCAVAMTFDLAHPWSELVRQLRSALPLAAGMWLDRFSIPVLINRYIRAYYVTPDQSVRLTIDTTLRAYDQRAFAYPNLTYPAPISEQVVVELKAGVEEGAARIGEMLAHFPARLTRCSKYVQGMMVGY